jgi:hypothetical protein
MYKRWDLVLLREEEGCTINVERESEEVERALATAPCSEASTLSGTGCSTKSVV